MMIETIPAPDRLSFIFPQHPSRNKKHEKNQPQSASGVLAQRVKIPLHGGRLKCYENVTRMF